MTHLSPPWTVSKDTLMMQSPLECVWHKNDEYHGQEIHLRCYECNHVYETDLDLINEFNARVSDSINRGKAEGEEPTTYADSENEINFCPFCLHDF